MQIMLRLEYIIHNVSAMMPSSGVNNSAMMPSSGV